jgi:HAD superfamily hydrolase (TIGR01509 family)
MTAKPVILLDDGGVMNNSRLRGPQWQRLVGEFFAPRLGGESTAWSEANRIHMISIFEPENWQGRVQAAPDYASFERTYWYDWLSGMCQLVGVETPPEAGCIELARQAETYITCRVHAAFPGAIEAICELHVQGYTLHTASGESSLNLHGYLQAMGVREYFGRLYGSDLLNMLKETPEYYERLFADAQIAPGDALIVDDTPRVLAWARDFGAMTVLINAERESVDGMLCIASLAELPELVRQNYK